MVIKSKEDYRLDPQGGYFYVIALYASYCPICQLVLLLRGTRQRVLYISEEEKQILIIRRLYCQECERIHHELPDCVVPYKRYSAKIIEDIVSDSPQEAPCSSVTANRIRSWWLAVKSHFWDILQTLVEKYGAIFGAPPAFKELVRAAANSNNWVFAHQVCTRSPSRPG